MISYDVACQWRKILRERIEDMPKKFKPFRKVSFRFAVPKCHLPGHKLPCQPPHSLNLLDGVGWTDGEGIEHGWSGFNGLAASTKEMGPGSRHDTIDDHISHHNWQKNVLLGTLSLSPH